MFHKRGGKSGLSIQHTEHSPGKVKIIQDFITFIQLSICFAMIFIIMTIELVLLDF